MIQVHSQAHLVISGNCYLGICGFKIYESADLGFSGCGVVGMWISRDLWVSSMGFEVLQ